MVGCTVNILALRHDFLAFLSKKSTLCCKSRYIEDTSDE